MLATETKLTDDWVLVVHRRHTGKDKIFVDHSCHGFVSYPKHTRCNQCGVKLSKTVLCVITLLGLDI
jgi:hypothetical protein